MNFMNNLCEIILCGSKGFRPFFSLLAQVHEKLVTGWQLSIWSCAGKEYGKADSRYILRDACTIGIEAITACVEGPLCLLCVIGYLRQCSWRQVLALLIVTGELYGTVLYFYSSMHEGKKLCLVSVVFLLKSWNAISGDQARSQNALKNNIRLQVSSINEKSQYTGGSTSGLWILYGFCFHAWSLTTLEGNYAGLYIYLRAEIHPGNCISLRWNTDLQLISYI